MVKFMSMVKKLRLRPHYFPFKKQTIDYNQECSRHSLENTGMLRIENSRKHNMDLSLIIHLEQLRVGI